MVDIKDVRLSVSLLGQNVYIGKLSKDGSRFIGQKKDITSDFIKAVIDKFKNSTSIIGAKGEIQYRLTVEEIDLEV